MITGFLRIAGQTAGVAACNEFEGRKRISAAGCNKAAKMIELCTRFHIPLLTITDTVENERDTLYQYSRIMDYRYDNKIRLSVDVDNDLLPCQIPKNILQPLAENSFYHGFPSLAEGQEGHIDIMIYTIDGEMIIEISDDGAGIPPERLEMLRNQSYEIYRDKKPHIGLDNIRQRLAFIYPGQYQFDIQSTEGYGTTISISIPLIRQQ